MKEVCDHLEASKTPSLSLLIPIICQLLQALYDLNGSLKIHSSRQVLNSVRNSVFTRMNEALKEPTSQISMMLDPRVLTKVLPQYSKLAAIQTLKSAFLEFPTVLASYRGQDGPSVRHRENAVLEVSGPGA